MLYKRYSVLDIWTDAVTQDRALAAVEQFVECGSRPHVVFATNPEKNFSVPKDPVLYNCFRNADLLLPDGIGMVLAVRLLYGVKLARVPGCEFMEKVCELAEEKGYPIFVYGATEEVNTGAVDVLLKRMPRLKIAGQCNGYFPEEKMNELVERINDSRAQILFLALGSPKQEKWFEKYQSQLKYVRVCQGIGGTLDVISGTVKRAPEFFCKTGLEWFYRLLTEPKRLNRQLVLPVFAWRVLVVKVKNICGNGNSTKPWNGKD